MLVSTMADLRQSVKAGEAEIVVADEKLARSVRLWNGLRTAANVLVIVVLAVAVVLWANPLRVPLFEAGWALIARRVILGGGILLLFADYVIPVVRLYKIAGSDSTGLKLVPRKTGR